MKGRQLETSGALWGQTGFSLLELSLAMSLGAVLAFSYLYNQSQDNQINTAKVQAGYFLQVNDAVGQYMQKYYDDLIVIPSACGKFTWTNGKITSAVPETCKFTSGRAKDSSPTNALAPTVAELQRLGFIEKSFSDRFLWKSVNNEPAIYVTRIQHWCNGSLVIQDDSSCSSAIQLKSLTFNSLEFSKPELGNVLSLTRTEQLKTAISVMGGDGLMSWDTELDKDGNGKLYSFGHVMSVDNPVRLASVASRGSEGILAIQNGVDVRCSAQRR